MFPEIRVGQLWFYVPKHTLFLITRIGDYDFECVWRDRNGEHWRSRFNHDRGDPPTSHVLNSKDYQLLENV